MKEKYRRFTAGLVAGCMLMTSSPLYAAVPGSLIACAAETVYEEGLKLEQDMTIDGDLRLNGGTLDLNGHSLTVKGSLWQGGGDLNIGKGTLHITGNYELRPNVDSWGTGHLYMTREDGVLDVDGSVEMGSSAANVSYQWNGLIRVGGDFRMWSNNNDSQSFAPWAELAVEFKGDNVHEVWANKPDVNYLSTVTMTGNGSLFLTDGITGFTLGSNVTFADGSKVVGTHKLELGGFGLTVDGDFYQSGEMEVNVAGSKLYVAGDYWQGGGDLNIGKGTLHITGNYELRPNVDSWGTGHLYMTREDGVLDVDGSVEMGSSAANVSYQWNGLIRVGGDFRMWSNNNDSQSFAPWAELAVEFKGDNVHEVWANKPDVNYLSTVTMTGNGSLYLSDGITGFTLGSDVTFADGSTVVGTRKLNLNGHTLTVAGDFHQMGEMEVNADGSKLYVAGDYWQGKGDLNIGNGTVNIAGNYELRPNVDSWGTGHLFMSRDEGVLITGGDVELASAATNALYQWAGTVAVGGDFRVWSNQSDSQSFAPSDAMLVEFRGGRAHEIWFNKNGVNYLPSVKLGVGDSITFTNGFGKIGAGEGSSITIDPEGIASVDGMTVTGVKVGESKMKLRDPAGTLSSHTLVVDGTEVEAAFDGKTITPTPGTSASGLQVKINPAKSYLIGQTADIPVTISGEIPDDAWITFVPSDVPHTEKDGDENNGDYNRLKDITDGTAHLKTPSKPGKYDIRVYDGDDAATAKEIAYKTVDILYSDLKANIRTDVKAVKPGEDVKVYVDILSGTPREDAWLAFVPTEIAHDEKTSDDHNGDYAYLPELSDGYVTITAPNKEGSWDIRLFDGEDGAYAKEISCITLTVSEDGQPGEPTSQNRNAYRRIQAESADKLEGSDTTDTSNPDAASSDGGVVGWTQKGGYAFFKNVDFESSDPAKSVLLRYSAVNDDCRVSIRLDALSENSTITEVILPKTSGWNDYRLTMANITPTTGVHDVYVFFETSGFNLDYFVFDRNEAVENPTEPPTETPTEKPTEILPEGTKMLGDCNLDGAIDIMDVISINRYLLGSLKFNNTQKYNANVDSNDVIDTTDSLLILKYVVELIDSFGESEEPTDAPPSGEFTASIANYSQHIPEDSCTLVRLDVNDVAGDAWVGIVPKDVGTEETDADEYDLTYAYVSDMNEKGDVFLSIPADTAPGEYHLRLYANDEGGALLDWVAVEITEPNTLEFHTDPRWVMADVTYDDGTTGTVPAVRFTFEYTGYMGEDANVRVALVKFGTPHVPLNEIDPDAIGGRAWAEDIVNGTYTSINGEDATEGNWELRAYADPWGGRELDWIEVPQFDIPQ